jgi:hypothetical protein
MGVIHTLRARCYVEMKSDKKLISIPMNTLPISMFVGLLISLTVCLINYAWMVFCGWTFDITNAWIYIASISIPLLILLVNRYRHDPKIFNICVSVILILVFTNAASILSYLVVSTNLPLVDAQLDAIDKLINFNWPEINNLVRSMPLIHFILKIAYSSLLPQLVFSIIFLSFTNRFAALYQFIFLIILSALITIAISGFFPAAGAWKYYSVSDGVDLSMLSHFELLRSGSLKTIDLTKIQGLISIPSYHAALAILVIYALRTSPILFPLALIWNFLLLLSIPTEGSHYLIDLLTGVLLAVILLLLTPKAFFKPRNCNSLNEQ